MGNVSRKRLAEDGEGRSDAGGEFWERLRKEGGWHVRGVVWYGGVSVVCGVVGDRLDQPSRRPAR